MDTAPCSCGCSTGEISRCDAALPDAPHCAINYHFGMLLGVEDFRAEQGFHVGQHRRHQAVLHGVGVILGFGVSFDAEKQELRVGSGHAVDPRGRDLVLAAPQCLALPAWWEAQRATDVFADLQGDRVVFDADVLLCYRACLARPVPAIADPCAAGTADIAYSRICEEVRLTLVRRRDGTDAAPSGPSYRLLHRLAGEVPPQDGPDETWLVAELAALDALADADRPGAFANLRARVAARAAAATAAPLALPRWRPPKDIEGLENRDDCLVIARLTDVVLTRDAEGRWTTAVGRLEIDGRATLLPTAALQALAPAAPPGPPGPSAGPVIESGSLADAAITLRFDKPLAPASADGAFAVTRFDAALGWSSLTVDSLAIDDGDRRVTLTLGAAPPAGPVRVTVTGRGPTPLLGADLVPAGARSATVDGEDLSLTLSRS